MSRESDRKYYQANRAKKLAYAKAYREKYRDKLKDYFKRYNEAHREDKLKYRKEHYVKYKDKNLTYKAENKERISEWSKAYLSKPEVKARRAQNARVRRSKNPLPDKLVSKRWRQANADYILQTNREYRARSYRASGTASSEQIQARVDYFGGICVYCKLKVYECIDHRIPLSRGGTNWPSNLVPACLACNSSKRNRTPEEFKQYLMSRDRL